MDSQFFGTLLEYTKDKEIHLIVKTFIEIINSSSIWVMLHDSYTGRPESQIV